MKKEFLSQSYSIISSSYIKVENTAIVYSSMNKNNKSRTGKMQKQCKLFLRLKFLL